MSLYLGMIAGCQVDESDEMLWGTWSAESQYVTLGKLLLPWRSCNSSSCFALSSACHS